MSKIYKTALFLVYRKLKNSIISGENQKQNFKNTVESTRLEYLVSVGVLKGTLENSI